MKETEKSTFMSEEVLKRPRIIKEAEGRGEAAISNYFPVSCISALENANDLILLVGINSIVQYSSSYIYELTGFSSDEIVGRSFFSFFLFDEATRIHAILKEIISEKRKFSLLRMTMLSKSGKKIVLEVNGVPVFRKPGELTGYFCIIRNITEREKAEEQLEFLVKELKESVAVKDKFFSIVAHDLKSPFHGLLGLSSILVSEFETLKSDEVKKYLMHINVTAKAVYNLVDDLLDWARMQTNHFDFQAENITLFKEVYKVEQLCSENASAKGLKIINKVNPDIKVSADLKMLQSILLGLITNATKFSYPGGQIIVDAEPSDGMILIKVADNGVGISKKDIGKLFKPDSHYTTLGTQKEMGTGLGLLLCKEQVEKNGGKIWVESEIKKGSTFFFTLPVAC